MPPEPNNPNGDKPRLPERPERVRGFDGMRIRGPEIEKRPEQEPSKIEELKKSLYSRNSPDVRTRRKLRYGEVPSSLRTAWERKPEEAEKVELNTEYKERTGPSMSFLTKLLVGSIVFCVIALGVGAYLFFNGANLISANNITIDVNGPVSVPGGVPVAFDITVTNNNSVDLQLVDMTVNFPPGSTDPKDPTNELTTYRELLGDIPQGQSVKKTVQAILFGEENTQKQVTVDITYQIKGSTASFPKEQTYDVLINSSPVNVTIDSFKEITSGQEFDITAKIKSNSSDTLKNVLLNANYPFGFTYLTSNIKPQTDNATWRLGDIPPGAERTVTIHGKIQGEDQDTRVFHFTVGSQSSRNPGAIGTQYMTAEQDIAINKPFISATVAVDGKTGTDDATAAFNQPVRVEVSWFNNLSSSVSDAQISVKLSGSAYDRTLVQSGTGYFRSATDEIIWNSQTTPQLANLGAGQSGTVSFTVTPRDLSSPGRAVTNPTVSLAVNITGRRTQESNVPQSLSSAVSRNININSTATLSGQVLRTVGPLANTGPIPPKADQSTTYTIQWTIDNTANSLHGATVTAKLPVNVKWTNQFSPPSENITYDNTTGIVTWNAGTVGTYTANSGQRRQVNFQVSLEPNVGSVGTSPTLVNDATLTAVDDFTGATVQSLQAYLTTRFSTDPSYRAGQEMVAP